MVSSVSTYTSYLSVNRDMKSSLAKVENQSTVKRDTEYYEANIGKVKTVDDFIGDYRLYSYAMKAYGLEEMTYGKAFMRKVLESDLSDSSSFANTLTDKRYLQFAQAFNFDGDTKTAQNTAQATKLTDTYKASFKAEEDRIKKEVDNFAAQIGKVTNVDDLVNNTRLRTYVLDAAGLDPVYTSKAYLKQVLTSDLSDENSVANKAEKPVWKKLAAAFNFKTDGTVNGQAQTVDQTEDLKLDYIASTSTFPSDTLLQANQRYWEKNSPKAASAQDLVKDSRLVAYLKTAFKLSATMFPSSVASLMYSETFANSYGNTKLLEHFNFNNDGSLPAGTNAQDATQISNVANIYKTAFLGRRKEEVDDAVKNYQTRVTAMTTLDEFFVSNKKDKDKKNDGVTEVWDVALRAYGIDPEDVSKTKLKKILTSDVDDKKSYVNTLRDDRYVELAKAFNFTSDGETKAPLTAQSEGMVTQLTSDYKNAKLRSATEAGREKAVKDADAEIEYYKKKIIGVSSVEGLLADTRLTKFVLEANGLNPKDVPTADLRKMFKSDLSDPKSFVNTQSSNKFAEIVASFNFNAKGELDPSTIKDVQQRGAIMKTTYQFARQTMEEQQGQSNEGVRLALYFKRKAADVSSPYTFLSDGALFQFFKTSYNLPAAIANMDVDKQAQLVKKFIEIDKLRDPDYVDKLVKRFTALYDAQNRAAASPALSLFTGPASISPDTLLAVSQLKSG